MASWPNWARNGPLEGSSVGQIRPNSAMIAASLGPIVAMLSAFEAVDNLRSLDPKIHYHYRRLCRSNPSIASSAHFSTSSMDSESSHNFFPIWVPLEVQITQAGGISSLR